MSPSVYAVCESEYHPHDSVFQNHTDAMAGHNGLIMLIVTVSEKVADSPF